MGKFVILQFINGNLAEGFAVRVQIGKDGDHRFTESIGRLPPAPHISQYYSQWQNIYFNLGLSLELPFRLEALSAQVTNYSIQDCNTVAQTLLNSLNTWLRSEPFFAIRERVLRSLKEDEEVRVFVQSQDFQLQRLPWHLCDLFKDLPKAEIVLSPSEAIYGTHVLADKPKVKILAIFGSSHGIDLQQDKALLQQLPNSEITFLVEPERQQLNEHLWDQSWSILFFAGHSSSQDNHEGRFYINPTEYLTINDLKYALSTARTNGLRFAIFNSCDGLGLARALAELQIPQVIVMREPVPDKVAQEFLRYFLKAFAQGKSFYLAVREARERLQGLEGQFPCVTWLPIICQNPAEVPLNWTELYRKPIPRKIPLIHGMIIASGVILTLLIVTEIFIKKPTQNNQINSEEKALLGAVRNSEQDRISLGEKILVELLTNSNKNLGAKAFAAGDFTTAINKFEKSLQENRNDPETLIYLNNAKIGNKSSLKIAVSVPMESNLNKAQEILRGVAQAQNEVNRNGGINGMLLKVAIANDENNPEIAKQVANSLVKDDSILGVVGHFASGITLAAEPIYQDGKLVVISPTSTSVDLSDFSPYFFRTVPNDYIAASELANYMMTKLKRKKAAIFFNHRNSYCLSLKRQFANVITSQGGKIVTEFDLYNPNFSAAKSINEALKQGAEVLLLVSDTSTQDKALQVIQVNHKRLPLLAGDELYTTKTLEVGGEFAIDLVLAVPWHIQNNSNSNFSRESSKLWGGTINWRTAMSYDATQAIITGLKQSDRTREGLQKTLSSPGFSLKGATGNVQFLPSGDRNAKTILVQVQKGNQSGIGYDFVPLPP